MFVNKIYDNICAISNASPGRPALLEADKIFSYADFKLGIDQAFHQISELQIEKGKRVGIFFEHSFLAHCVIYAAALSELTYVPLSITDPSVRLRTIIELSQVDSIFCEQETFAKLVSVLSEMPEQMRPSISRFPSDLKITEEPKIVPTLCTNLYILFTSGSTGTPKGVLIKTDGVENFLNWAGDYFKFNQQDRFLSHSRFTFDLSVFNMFLPFMFGGSAVLVKKPAEQMYPGKLLEKDVTIALFVPRVTNLLNEARQLKLASFPKLRHLLFCGEKLLASQVNIWRHTHPNLQIHNIYGPTETTVTCTYYSLDSERNAEDPIPIGYLIPNMAINFLDIHQNILKGPIEGEAIISGIGVSTLDYIGMDTNRFFEHPILGRCFRTGDLVSRDSKGCLFWTGRLDTQIKIRGFRVELSEIESVLSLHPDVLDSAVVFFPDKQVLYAAVVLKEESEESDTLMELIKVSLERKLPAYMIPERIVTFKSLPKNNNGKLDRLKLKSLFESKTS